MCGINGIYAWDAGAPPVDEAELLRVRERMRDRGPDGAGAWTSEDRRVGLGHRRLAILDLSDAGAQPMASADGRHVITFNGEIYNFRELRRELEVRGRVFRTGTDTEVLLHLYAEHGPAMAAHLRGMFAFAIWDAEARSLCLARDPFGIKPLYLAESKGVLRFASQVKALLAGAGVDDAPEPAGAVGFLLWGAVPEPYTLYRGIRALPPGSTLLVRPEGPEAPRAYFSVRQEFMVAQEQARAFGPGDRPRLAEQLADAVRHHLVADVPVAVFLSAGVDSNVIAALAAREATGQLHSLTLGFEELRGTPGDETDLAARSAARVGLAHATRWIGRGEFEAERGRLLEAMDQPSIDGINTFFVCREAARAGHKVALSGLGGDELFGGYPSFRQVPRLARALAWARAVAPAGRLARRIAAPLLAGSVSPKFAGLLEYGGSVEGAYLLRRALHMPWEIEALLDPVAMRVGLERLATLPSLADSFGGVTRGHAKVAALESQWYLRNQLLRDADWAGMAHGVEVRVPFVDATLFRAIAPWIVSEAPPRKADMAQGLCPPELVRRVKTGFVAPVREWLHGGKPAGSGRGLRGWARELLPTWPRQFRVLALVTDAWGSGGGIAQFNRNLLEAIAAMPDCAEAVVLPRHGRAASAEVPSAVRVCWGAANGKPAFVREALRQSFSGPWDLVLCGHIHLAPVAAFASAVARTPFHVVVHGIDAWQRHPSRLVNRALRLASGVVGVSRLTLERFSRWAGIPPGRFRHLPNAVDLTHFFPGPRPADLQRALGLEGRTVLMTLGRLVAAERYKGIDEVLEALPDVARRVPAVTYLVCGDGDDRPRLEAKARELGVADRVVFAGFIPEERKPDYYRLADAYVMPSRGEGFGIVFLEAMASGVPTVASTADGGREALLEGRLGVLVDPSDPASVREGILHALATPRGVPDGLACYSLEAFRANVARLVREATRCAN